MASWNQLSMVLTLLAFELDVFSLMTFQWAGSDNAVEAMEICGFLCLLIALLLVLLTHFGELRANRGAEISFIVFAFVACAFMIIGLSIYGSKVNKNVPIYPTTMLVTGAFLALLAGIFSVMNLRGC